MKTFLLRCCLLLLPSLAAAQPIFSEALQQCPAIFAWGAPNQVQAAPVGDGLRVSWMPAAAAPTAIAAFEIARAEQLAGPYALIGLANGGDDEFVDRTAVPGTIYFYRVRALANSNCTPWSDPARGMK